MADSLPVQAVEAIMAATGEHPGHRVAHARGTVLAGSFTATPAAAELTRAPHMQGEPIDVTVRFSNGSGNPEVPDYAREGRGMATKFYLPDGEKTDIVALTMPAFFVRTPEDFLSFTHARTDPEKLMPDWIGAHPEALPALQAFLASGLPASYAGCAYNSIHSFRWIDADGKARYVRYRW